LGLRGCGENLGILELITEAVLKGFCSSVLPWRSKRNAGLAGVGLAFQAQEFAFGEVLQLRRACG
jgi:hypothetical protein